MNALGLADTDYSWIFPSDATIQGTGKNVEIFFGLASGQVCVEVGCPVQQQLCWEVEIGTPASLLPLNPTPQPCTNLLVEDYVEDVNNVDGRPVSYTHLTLPTICSV